MNSVSSVRAHAQKALDHYNATGDVRGKLEYDRLSAIADKMLSGGNKAEHFDTTVATVNKTQENLNRAIEKHNANPTAETQAEVTKLTGEAANAADKLGDQIASNPEAVLENYESYSSDTLIKAADELARNGASVEDMQRAQNKIQQSLQRESFASNLSRSIHEMMMAIIRNTRV